MLDIGFQELFVVFVIALIVLGPERLPTAARTIGQWLGRARGFVRSMSNELEREVRRSEAAKSFEQASQAARQASETVKNEVEQTEAQIGSATRMPGSVTTPSGQEHADGQTAQQAKTAAQNPPND